jgi:hypothetical protein
MGIKDVLGLLLSAVGIGMAALGYRLLGLTWFWIGAACLFFGLMLVLNEVRGRKLKREMRHGGGPGDYGNRNYLSGSSASDFSDAGAGDGGGGD